jgi:FkbM family methyltransferase
MKSPSVRQTNAAKQWGRWDNYLEEYLDNPKVIIDVGANIGYSSKFFAKHYPQATVYAIEPVKDNFSCLVLNVAEYINIIPYNVAMGAARGELTLSLTHNAEKNLGMMSAYGVGVRAETVRMYPMDELPVKDVDFIKIDVEGYELEVLKGATNILNKYEPLIQMETNDDAHEYLLEIGYEYITRRSGDDFYVKSGT